ncbi:MAG: potassium channel family protein [Sphingomonadales bacterium]
MGTIVVAVTVVIHTVGLMGLTALMARLIRFFSLHNHGPGETVAMVATVLGIFVLHTAEVWIWAPAYYKVDATANFKDALYFSTTTFSTLGYGDIVLSRTWRQFGAIEGVNGFILIGWSTAYLVAASMRYGPFRSGEHF